MAQELVGSRTAPEMIAGDERVDIEALTYADVALPVRNQPLGGGKIFRSRDLQVLFAPLDHQRNQTGRLRDRRVIWQVTADGASVGCKDRIEVKALRGLCPP